MRMSLLGDVGIRQLLSSPCRDGENCSWSIVQWRLACDIQMSWTHSLCELLVHPGKLANYFLLPLWTGLTVLLISHGSVILVQFHDKVRVWRCHLCISAILLASVMLFLKSFPQSIPCICLPLLVTMVNPYPMVYDSSCKNVACTQTINISIRLSIRMLIHSPSKGSDSN